MNTARGPYTFFGLLWRLALAGSLVLSTAAAGGYYAAQHLIEAPEAQAPDLLTMPLPEAVERASAEGFAVLVEKRESTDLLEPGRVLAQRPMPSTWAKVNSTIRITLSEKR